jgi:stage II sporulation protein D
VAIVAGARRPLVGAAGDWRLMERETSSLLVRGTGSSRWHIETRASKMRAVMPDGTPTAWRNSPLLLKPVRAGDFVSVDGKPYRGELWLVARPNDMVQVINVLPVESYLRGVVPLEIGTQRTEAEFAAVAAQAIAARTYTYAKLPFTRGRPYDLAATVDDQVYGGVNGERPLGDRAVETTRGLVLKYGNQLAQAPYSATCGGQTAAQPEVWTNKGDEPYLQRVSDLIPGTDRYYCDIGPRFSWSRTYSQQDLILTLEKYLRGYAKVTTGSVGAPRLVAVDKLTPSGRVASLTIVTDRDRFQLKGNDIRFVLRATGGEILNSTYFSVESDVGRDGRLSRVTFTGRGNGHGIGMCQWGAIGRARAGQDFRTILRTYYQGTTIGQIR